MSFLSKPWQEWKDWWKGADKKLDDAVGTTARKNAERLTQAQIKSYQDQSKITQDAINEARQQKAVEKQRIDEKRVRALRRNYRTPGFLGSGSVDAPPVQNLLGG